MFFVKCFFVFIIASEGDAKLRLVEKSGPPLTIEGYGEAKQNLVE